MDQNPIAESFYIVPMGDSGKPYDLVRNMLYESICKEGKERDLCLDSTIILLIDMRLDGILDNLFHKYSLRKARQQRAELAHALFVRSAKIYLLSLLVPKEPEPEVMRFMNLGMAVAYLWELPDGLVSAIKDALKARKIQVRPLQLPRPDNSDIA